jgi:hypothetical protein
MRNRRSSNLRKDYKAHIPILVQEGPWSGESVLLVPRRPNGLDRYPWLLCKKVDGRVIERRFCSEQVVSSAWQPRSAGPA